MLIILNIIQASKYICLLMSENLTNSLESTVTPSQKKTIASFITCILCKGFLRMAHTVRECGHSFCQQCLFGYLKTFRGRNPDVKCPECHQNIQLPFHKSIMRDPYRQNLVNAIDPINHHIQKTIIERVKKLFPQYNVSFFLDEYFVSRPQNKSERTRIMKSFVQTVKEKLGYTFDFFVQKLETPSGFEEMLQMIQSKNGRKNLIQVKPRRQRDMQFVNIDNKIQIKTFGLIKLKRFLEKRVLLRMQMNEDLAREWIDLEYNQIKIKINMWGEGRKLQKDEDVRRLCMQQKPIYYSIQE